MKLLLADDSETIRAHFSVVLSEHGFVVSEVESGDQALHVLENDQSIDVVLLDCNMPGLTGAQVCERVRKLPRTRYAYIILFTATGQSDDVVRGLAAGADDFVLKSTSEEELVARLRNGARIIDLQNRLLSESNRRAHAQRMESVGHLSTGLAHQLNTPTQYVIHNLEFLSEELPRMMSAIAKQENEPEDQGAAPLDIPFLLDEVPQALQQSIEGLHQIRGIVAALKDFAQPPSLQCVKVNINAVIRNVLSILGEAGTAGTTIEAQLDPAVPEIDGFADDFNQVVLHLIVQARDALKLRPADAPAGSVKVSTSLVEGSVVLMVTDDGAGLTPEQQAVIFDPFLGGAGPSGDGGGGLYFVQVAMTQRHAGQVSVESELSRGTSITVRLPVE